MYNRSMNTLIIAIALSCQTKPFIEIRPHRLADEQKACVVSVLKCMKWDIRKPNDAPEGGNVDVSRCFNEPTPCFLPGFLRWAC